MEDKVETSAAESDLIAASDGDEAAFERLVKPHQAGTRAHCYRMLGSAQDAEDALQETLLRAWRSLRKFEGRSSFSSWIYRIATNVCLTILEKKSRLFLPVDYDSAAVPRRELAAPLLESVWVDPFPDGDVEVGLASPSARYEQRESVELAFIAALQLLPARQRAVLLMRDVLGFAPAEIADAMETSAAAVSSALQRAHETIDRHLPQRSQQATLRSIGDADLRDLVEKYVSAWEENDVEGLRSMLTEDASFAMPPRPTWYLGPDDIAEFLAAQPFAGGRRWLSLPIPSNGQVAVGHFGPIDADGVAKAHSVEVLTLDDAGRISAVISFLDEPDFANFGMPDQITQ